MDFDDVIRLLFLALFVLGPVVFRERKKPSRRASPPPRPEPRSRGNDPFAPAPQDRPKPGRDLLRRLEEEFFGGGLQAPPKPAPPPPPPPVARETPDSHRSRPRSLAAKATRPAEGTGRRPRLESIGTPELEGLPDQERVLSRLARGTPSDGGRTTAAETLAQRADLRTRLDAPGAGATGPSRARRLLGDRGARGLREAILVKTILDAPPGLRASTDPELPGLRP